MILKYMQSMFMFATSKKHIISGNYFIQAPPKRPLTSYLVYSQQARKNLSPQVNSNVAQSSKKLGDQWKLLKPEQKQKYEKKAAELNEQYKKQKAIYEAKFVEPFKKINYNNLMLKQFHSKNKNKFASIGEAAKAFSQYKKTLKEEEIDNYKKLAEKLNKDNESLTKKYQIPTLEYKDFNSYLRFLRKENPNIPLKSKIQEKDLQKYEKQYEQYRAQHANALKNFARSFSIKLQDLLKQFNKKRDQSEKLNEQGQTLKQVQKQEKQKAIQQLKITKEKARLEKAKLRLKQQKEYKRQEKKIDKQVEKSKKGVVRAQNKYAGRLNRNKRQRQQLELQKQAIKNLNKSKKVKAQGNAQTQNPAQTQTKAPATTQAKTESTQVPPPAANSAAQQ